ncbi:hypothetical protein MMC07_005613 [Pseudocyphellaria aurata]|nr:hypothetical protein [Pseudocyphellaria aurata]
MTPPSLPVSPPETSDLSDDEALAGPSWSESEMVPPKPPVDPPATFPSNDVPYAGIAWSKYEMIAPEYPVIPPRTFDLSDEEAYAGTSRSEWESIVSELNHLTPVNTDVFEIHEHECGICQEPIGSADDGGNAEEAVSLPCQHVFGNHCISKWIAMGQNANEHEDSPNHPVGPDSFDDLLPREPCLGLNSCYFTCPICRQGWTISTREAQAPAIVARLRFWDSAYEKLGIVRSAKEEESRKDLWEFVENVPKKVISKEQLCSYDLRARVSAMRFALQESPTDAHSHLRAALFNLACIGLEDAPKAYCAEWYEDQKIPIWCWQFDRIERGIDPAYHWGRGADYCYGFFKDWKRQRLGPWRRTLMAELKDDRLVYHSNDWWIMMYECWHDAMYVSME